MLRSAFALFLFASLLIPATPLAADQPRASPHETISRIVDGNRITIVYGRPYSKDPNTGEIRKIWASLVPYGKVWRTGADEATMLITQQPITLAGSTIPAGAYTLYTQLETDGSAKLIVNKQLGQWGTQYEEKQDIARIPLKKEPLSPPLDQFTIALEKDDEGTTGFIKLMWERTQFTVPFTVRK